MVEFDRVMIHDDKHDRVYKIEDLVQSLLVRFHHMGTNSPQQAAINSKSLKDPCEPGPAQGLSLLKSSFTLSGAWALGSHTAPGDNFNCNRHYIQ